MDGTFLRDARKKSGLHMHEVAKELGVDPQTVFRWEKHITMMPDSKADEFFDLMCDHGRIEEIKNSRKSLT